MSTSHLLLFAVITITFALIFYTLAVWSSKIQKQLRLWHVIMFCLGFISDVSGTLFMAKFARLTNSYDQLHSITGTIALGLMLIGVSWAIYTYIRGNEVSHKNFSRFSIVVWIIWLITYFMGMLIGMAH